MCIQQPLFALENTRSRL